MASILLLLLLLVLSEKLFEGDHAEDDFVPPDRLSYLLKFSNDAAAAEHLLRHVLVALARAAVAPSAPRALLLARSGGAVPTAGQLAEFRHEKEIKVAI